MPQPDPVVARDAPACVLVVDDNPDHRRLIRLRLHKLGLEDVREAGTGEEALTKLRDVQLVLCDYQLPGMNGLETMAEIRSRSDASVIMVTGASSENLVVSALRAGAVDYLVKDPGFLNALPLVIERAWRHHDLVVRASELQRLSLLVTSASTREEILGGIVSGARRLLRAQACVLLVNRDDDVVAEASDGVSPAENGLLLAKAKAGLDLLDEALRDPSPTRHLLVPLRSEGVALGSLALVVDQPRVFPPEEIRLAETFASFAGIALANLHRMELQHELVERLQGLNDLRRDLISSVSHELRTPLTSIVGFGATLHERWDVLDDARRRQMVVEIREQAAELTEQVDRLLDVGALEGGRVHGSPTAVELAHEVNTTMAALAPLTDGRAVEVDVPAVRVLADPVLLRRVLTNLVSNAVKYSAAGSPVSVRASAADGRVQVDVVDRGVGLTPDEAQRAFEPFWRSTGAVQRATRGAGVGLALVKEYARLMGGEAFVTSRPGVGSVFSFTLPLAVPDAAPLP